MAKQQYLEIANFILRFGDKHQLLDLMQEIVLPAFVGGSERTYRDTRYMLIQVKLSAFQHRERRYPVILGRFIKATKLKRNQIFDNESKGLIKSELSLDTAPSSIFVLVLEGHRLLFAREHNDSPGLEAFRTTISRFITTSYYDYLDRLYDAAKGQPGRGGEAGYEEIHRA